jgi:hypothetical protein
MTIRISNLIKRGKVVAHIAVIEIAGVSTAQHSAILGEG